MRLLYSDRIGKSGQLSIGTSAVIFDTQRQKILLTQRQDNGRWCLPGGRMEPGENVVEACVREVREETGLEVQVQRLIGVYSSPHLAIEYADGKRYQLVAFSFEAQTMGGALRLSDETTDYGYFMPAEIAIMDVMEHHILRIQDALIEQASIVLQ